MKVVKSRESSATQVKPKQIYLLIKIIHYKISSSTSEAKRLTVIMQSLRVCGKIWGNGVKIFFFCPGKSKQLLHNRIVHYAKLFAGKEHEKSNELWTTRKGLISQESVPHNHEPTNWTCLGLVQKPYFSCAEPNWMSSTLERHWRDIWFRRRTACRT